MPPNHHPLESALALSWPPPAWSDVSVLAAVSGGADSVALLRAMAAVRVAGHGRLVVGHVNHQLRGADSAADAEFVADLASELGLECRVVRIDVRADADRSGDGLEAAARRMRYAALRAVCNELGARYLATAHNADDQAETILHHIVRGTGLLGLAGMSRCRVLDRSLTLIRPLLDVRRAELMAYLADVAQAFRHDASNRNLDFTRNRIRHELLPHLAAEYNERVAEALVRLGQLAGEANTVIDGLVEQRLSRHVDRTPTGDVSIACPALADEPPYLVRSLLISVWHQRGWPRQAMGHVEWDALAQMIRRPAGELAAAKRVFPGQVTAERRGERLWLAGPPGADARDERHHAG